MYNIYSAREFFYYSEIEGIKFSAGIAAVLVKDNKNVWKQNILIFDPRVYITYIVRIIRYH